MKSLRSPLQRDELFRRLQNIHPSSPRRWGFMSPHQMICHLSDGYRLYLGEKHAAPVKTPAPKWLVRWIALRAPFPWPRGIKTMPEIDQAGRGTPPREFAGDLQELQNLLGRVAALPPDFAFPEHPYLGRLSYDGWMRLAYLHADHHLRQFGV